MRTFPLLAAALLCAGCHGAERAFPETLSTAPPTPAAAPKPPQDQTIDLATALRIAAGGHLDVLEARARVRAAEGRASSADGYLLPILSIGGAVSNSRGTAQSSFGELREVEFSTVTAASTIRVSANVGESIYKDVSAHREAEAVASLELGQVQTVLLDVTAGYIDLVESDATVRIQEQFVQELQTFVRLAQAREAQGLGSALDSERARAQLAAAEQRLLAARNLRQRRSKALAVALRLDATVALVPVDKDLQPARLIPPTDTLQEWLGRAQTRPELRAYRLGRDAAQAEASAARWSVWGPEFSAGAAFGGLGDGFNTVDDRRTWLVSLGWNFSFGGPGRIETADARAEQSEIALQRYRERLDGDVAASFEELTLARQQLDPAARELAAAEAALRIARANYEGGVLSEIELLLAQQAADQARLRRLLSVSRYNQAQVRLIGAAGVGSTESLAGVAPSK